MWILYLVLDVLVEASLHIRIWASSDGSQQRGTNVCHHLTLPVRGHGCATVPPCWLVFYCS